MKAGVRRARRVVAASTAVASVALAAWALFACGRASKGAKEMADVFVPDGPPDVSVGEAAVIPEASLPPGQVDRDGHPLVTVLLVPGSLQDEYNALGSFAQPVPRTLEDAVESRLVAMDTIALGDGGPDEVDWEVPEGGTHPLLPLFLTDVLLVDTALPCTADGGYAPSYLAIEKEIYLDGGPHTTCGGRTPAEDVVDETLTLTITGGRVPVTQGVAGPTKPPTTTFPYLAPPN
ncbi:MAG TPA: DUF4331 family protein [Polyangiaceae bacterium]